MVARQMPAAITAGLTFEVTFSFPDYLATAWDLTLHLRGPKNSNVVAVDDGLSHNITISAADTSVLTPGQYWYAVRVTDGTATFEAEKGTLQILPDLTAQVEGYDGRTQAEIALEAIDAVLANRATIDQERYRINNRELYRTPIDQLLKLRSYYASTVARERGTSGGRFGRQIPVRFS